jgi:hypothetical protein
MNEHGMNGQAAGERDQRADQELRRIFADAFNIVAPYMAEDGSWLSQAHECLAGDELARRFPEITGMRLFGVLGTIASVRASGRRPTPG